MFPVDVRAVQDEQVGDFKVSLGDELSEVRPPLSSGVDIGPGIDQGLDDLQGGLSSGRSGESAALCASDRAV